MRGKHGVRVFMLSPHGRMSAFQRAQMYSLQDDNIFNIAVRGMFDDAQDIVKAVSNDHAFKAKYKIGAVNSINWARVAAQVVYYFKGYFAATDSNDEQVAFVPCRRATSATSAPATSPAMMGLPVAKLILATNENDVLDEFFRTGVYRPRNTRPRRTPPPARRWTSPRPPTSSASSSTWSAATAPRCASCGPRSMRARLRPVAAPRIAHRPSSASFPAAATTPTVWRPSARVRADYGTMIDTHTADGLKVAWSSVIRRVRCHPGAGNRPAGQVRGNHRRGPGPQAGTPGRPGEHRGAAPARRGDGAMRPLLGDGARRHAKIFADPRSVPQNAIRRQGRALEHCREALEDGCQVRHHPASLGLSIAIRCSAWLIASSKAL
jgi:hypothetical protein